MKCQTCNQAEAVVHIKEMRNDKVTELHLCERCAREKGFQSMLGQGKASLASQFIWMAENLYPNANAQMGGVQCPECGLPYSEFLQGGRLGCPECYASFAAQLKPILRRVHGAMRHVGKAPGKDGRLFERRQRVQKLHEDLERAIEREEYERAATLRDEIRGLETAEKQELIVPPQGSQQAQASSAEGEA
ncbi:MAG: UvrB/UvrC motif-containing protein [Candidatus Eisenbacteria bacterium]|nr:UvrB/UvrC motif-containing protein [Candidatus Eisenbacteria bacterium]